MVEAILATCAAQPGFSPATFGLGHQQKDFVGGGFGANNPVRQVITEAHSVFGGNTRVSSLLSLGSGHPGIIQFDSNGGNNALYQLALEMILDCEQKAQEAQEQMGRIGIYFRFSVEQGMRKGSYADSEALGCISAQTEIYLSTPETTSKLDEYVKRLAMGNSAITLQQLSSYLAPFSYAPS